MTYKYIYMIFYDIPNQDTSVKFKRFRKEIKQLGGIMSQESVYMFFVTTKAQANHIKVSLRMLAPDDGHVRGLLLTEEAFEQIDLIQGDLEIGEKLMKRDYFVIEV